MAPDYLVPADKTSGTRSPIAETEANVNAPGRSGTWRHQAQRLRTEALVFYFAFKHPRVTWFARCVAICTAAYLLSPVQLIPSYIPVIGFLDDVLVLFLGVKLLRRIIPKDVLAECRQRAEVLEAGGIQKFESAASIAIVLLWLVASVTASALMVRHFRR